MEHKYDKKTDDDKVKKNSVINGDAPKHETAADEEDFSPKVSTEVVRETIKQKPVNKKRLLRRTGITIALAAVFGLIASLSFLLLEPIISNWLYPEKQKTDNVTFQEETQEILPQQMYVTDKQMEQSEQKSDTQDLEKALSEMKLTGQNYQQMYDALKDISEKAQKSLVTVTDVTSDVDWLNNTYENKADTAGVIIADNGKSLIILADDDTMHKAEQIEVTFVDGTAHSGTFVQYDPSTGLTVISVPDDDITDETRESIVIAEMGSTKTSSLEGTPVIAKGSLSGADKAVDYGMITSEGYTLDLPDSQYKVITTDMYGAQDDSGVLFDLNGKIIGMIDNRHNTEDGKSLISAYAISDIKSMVQDMSNDKKRVYLGIHATDVPEQVVTEQDIPEGIYITSIDMDSPAMKSGLQSGDIIVSADGNDMKTYSDLLDYIEKRSPDDTIHLSAKRQSGNEYVKVPAEATLTELK